MHGNYLLTLGVTICALSICSDGHARHTAALRRHGGQRRRGSIADSCA
jgi:hypothetical protein